MGLDMYVKKVKKPDLIQEKLFKVRTQELDKDGYVLFDLDDENEAALCKEIMPYAVEADLTASFFDEDKLRKDLTIPDNMHLVITQGGGGARNISLTYAEEKTWRFPISYEDAKEIYKNAYPEREFSLDELMSAQKETLAVYLLNAPDKSVLKRVIKDKEKVDEALRLADAGYNFNFLGCKNGEFYLSISERVATKTVEIDPHDFYEPGGKYTRDEVRHYAIFEIGSPIRQWRNDDRLSEALAKAYKKDGVELLNCGYYPLSEEAKKLIKEGEKDAGCTYNSHEPLEACPYKNECVCYTEWY